MAKGTSLRIHPRNKPLLDLPESHPARATLVARAICQRDCAGREIQWPNGPAPIDQLWDSVIDNRRWTFSGFIYAYVCFDLILEEWVERPAQPTSWELEKLNGFSRLNGLLDECVVASKRAGNEAVLEMIPKARTFFQHWQKAIELRHLLDC